MSDSWKDTEEMFRNTSKFDDKFVEQVTHLSLIGGRKLPNALENFYKMMDLLEKYRPHLVDGFYQKAGVPRRK
ncbi:MAG: hypothetical protein IT215_02440 [Chitinophagaceae bacterium]|nr:hypothetical protein [Chitinophagaceae bacterium]